MATKLVVLYPAPLDPDAFEQAYFAQHMPLMRRFITPVSRTPTFKVAGRSAPFYRMAEVHFESREALSTFFGSAPGEECRRSAEKLSSGGPPLHFVCEADDLD